jgi:hypothetical protein
MSGENHISRAHDKDDYFEDDYFEEDYFEDDDDMMREFDEKLLKGCISLREYRWGSSRMVFFQDLYPTPRVRGRDLRPARNKMSDSFATDASITLAWRTVFIVQLEVSRAFWGGHL